MTDCLFCKILKGDIPASKVAENSGALAFNDISPVAPKHILVIPKSHHPDISTLVTHDPSAVISLLELARDVAQGEPFRLVFNTGAEVGQSVFHAHAHVLAGRDFAWPPG